MYTLRFRIFVNQHIGIESEEFTFKLENQELILRSNSGGKICDSKDLVFSTKNFPTIEKAKVFSARLKSALLATSIELLIGVDFGKNKSTSSVAKKIKDEMLQDHGHQILDDVHGTTIYQSEPRATILKVYMETKSTSSPEGLFNCLSVNFSRNIEIPYEIQLPTELYCAAGMESSPSAKFLLLMNCLEELAVITPKTDDELELIDIALTAINNADAPKELKDQVKNDFSSRKNISSRRAILNLVGEYDKDCISIAEEIIKYRAKIAHPNSSRDETSQMLDKANILVQGILKQRIL